MVLGSAPCGRLSLGLRVTCFILRGCGCRVICQLVMMWSAVGLVVILVLLVCTQLLFELHTYGTALVRGYRMDGGSLKEQVLRSANERFFYSFTGSIVYGHGQPRGMLPFAQPIVPLLSDTLFMCVWCCSALCVLPWFTTRSFTPPPPPPRFISLRLLGALSCDYTSSPPVLVADPDMLCWEGEHRVLAAASFIACVACARGYICVGWE